VHPNAILRYTAGSAVVAFFAFGGIAIGAASVLMALATAFLCMGFHGDRGERIWLAMTLAAFAFVAIMAWSGTTECPPEAPNHCGVGR